MILTSPRSPHTSRVRHTEFEGRGQVWRDRDVGQLSRAIDATADLPEPGHNTEERGVRSGKRKWDRSWVLPRFLSPLTK
jgi:hypothetical protein